MVPLIGRVCGNGCDASVAGLVDYVSDPGTPAVDRALKLAEEIAVNGKG